MFEEDLNKEFKKGAKAIGSPLSWNFGISSTAGGGELGRLRSSSPSQVQVQRGEAELNLDLTRGT